MSVGKIILLKCVENFKFYFWIHLEKVIIVTKKSYTTNVALHFLKFYYLGECHCQNDLLEHYDDQSILHCYEEYTQGPCMEEQIFYQPVELDDNGAQKNPISNYLVLESFFLNHVPLVKDVIELLENVAQLLVIVTIIWKKLWEGRVPNCIRIR